MARTPKPPPAPAEPDDQQARAVAAVRRGLTLREVAQQFGVSHVTVARWVRAAPPEGRYDPAQAPPPGDAPAAPADAPEGPLDLLAIVRAQLDAAIAIAKKAEAAGHYAAAASGLRQIAIILPILARVEDRMNANRDTVQYSKAEIEAAIAGVEERARAYLARPLQCATCGRELSVAWGQGYDTAVAQKAAAKRGA